jgi:DNA-binding winged helix-turn-helix (wHTH) protein
MSAEPGRLSRAAIHSEAGEAELKMTAEGFWQLAVRPAREGEWHVACSGDLNGGAISPVAVAEREPLRFGKLLVDTDRRRAFVGDRELRLSRLEYALLATLASRPTQVIGKRELMKTVWGCDGIVTRTLDSHASRLRVKIERAGAPGFVINTKAVGYRLWDGSPMAPAVERGPKTGPGVRSETIDLNPETIAI